MRTLRIVLLALIFPMFASSAFASCFLLRRRLQMIVHQKAMCYTARKLLFTHVADHSERLLTSTDDATSATVNECKHATQTKSCR